MMPRTVLSFRREPTHTKPSADTLRLPYKVVGFAMGTILMREREAKAAQRKERTDRLDLLVAAVLDAQKGIGPEFDLAISLWLDGLVAAIEAEGFEIGQLRRTDANPLGQSRRDG